jgi:Helix-turn-helix domain
MDKASKHQRGEQLFALRKLKICSTQIESKNIAGSVLKSVLRAIDDHGDVCWASSKTIADETCLAERTVRYAIAALKALGYISLDARSGRTSTMTINWDNITNPGTTPAQYAGVSAATTPAPRATTPAPRATTPAQYAYEAILKREKKRKRKFNPPKLEEIEAYCMQRKSSVDPNRFFDYFDAGGWKDSNGKPVSNWKQKLITWETHPKQTESTTESPSLLPLI